MKQYANDEIKLATVNHDDINFGGFEPYASGDGLRCNGRIDGVPVTAFFSGEDSDDKDWSADFTGAEINLAACDRDCVTDDEIDAMVERFA